MDGVYSLLQKKSVRDLTMEEVAKRAKVGKPTLYKWWPTKATLVLAMVCERMAPNLEKPSDLTAEESLQFRVRSLIDAFSGPFGKIVAGLIAEGQSEPAIRQAFFDRWVSPRRTLARSIIASYWARARLPDGSAKNWSSKSSVGIAREMPGVDGKGECELRG
jgi:AcrR family transcriptional regulator